MTTFIDLNDYPVEYTLLENSRIVVLPVPYDGTSTWIKGADKGPEAILEATQHMEFYDYETDSEVCKLGIYTAEPVTEQRSPELMVKAVYENVKNYINQEKFLVTLGGEHSISIGAIQAHSEKYGDLSILQFDAHTDLRQEYLGSRYNHACAMARSVEYCSNLVQVGIRAVDVSEKPFINREKVFFAEQIQTDKEWQSKVLNQLTKNVYITFDLDAFDPSIMPSTGTPEPGGLLWYEVIDLLKMVIQKYNMVGFDVVELCPNQNNKAPDFMAAKLIYKILTYKFALENKL
jgi:agmatinase